LIRKIYLYLFSMLGLVLIIIGAVRFIDMGLKTYVFKYAYEDQRLNYERPMSMPDYLVEQKDAEKIEITQDQMVQVKSMIVEYENWQERQEQVNPITARKHRDASINLSLMLVGLPLYLYHWFVIRRELRK